MPAQAGWRWCSACSSLFHETNKNPACPATGAAHNGAGSADYHLWHTEPAPAGVNHQNGWMYCNQCGILHYAGHPGVCKHTKAAHKQESYNYAIPHNTPAFTPTSQPGWKWCTGCSSLVYPTAGGNKCSNGAAHNTASSGEYALEKR
eukprot:TRINITY_DN4679_c0_g1_i1.p2 TRINITY_DN4679_c0_g1~~TRINITY_DN4679_c0_g1_i1.p2  ORF type:complete len:147 (+),score=36.41 TRINITY_DN4679_c0_g1_i1:84-524(+)